MSLKEKISGLNEAAAIIHQNAVNKGFWEGEKNVGELLMLVVSELAEALEAHRKGKEGTIGIFENDMSYGSVTIDDFHHKNVCYNWIVNRFECTVKDTFEDEIADSVIRLLDLSAGLGIDIEKHIVLKAAYNEGRPRLHGKLY
jgi:NTP pyrophosphatase (non-canonical NTP hydrolase)